MALSGLRIEHGAAKAAGSLDPNHQYDQNRYDTVLSLPYLVCERTDHD